MSILIIIESVVNVVYLISFILILISLILGIVSKLKKTKTFFIALLIVGIILLILTFFLKNFVFQTVCCTVE